MQFEKVIVSTIFKVCNYGTILQTYATQTILEKLGYKVELLNYKPNRLKTWNVMLTSDKPKTNLKNRIYRILSILYRMPGNLVIKRKFNKFRNKYIKMTKLEYTSFEDIENNIPEAEVYITGSDQVWNSDYNKGIDKAYYLDFAPINKPRISYAASIGMEDFKKDEKEDIKHLLAKYKHIGVREISAQKAIERLGLKADLVLDPTFLLNKAEWNTMSGKALEKNKYLLLYILGRDKSLIKYAEIIAKQRNLKIVKLGLDFIHSPKIDKSYSFATPNNFVNLFINSDYIITNSFHGLAFAINFNKQFIAISPKSYNTRLKSILTVFNLEERMIVEEKQLGIEDINYKSVNIELEKLRNKSIKFLKESVG